MEIKYDFNHSYFSHKYSKFELMKTIILNKKWMEVKLEWIRDLRRHPNRDDYAIGDLVYLNYEGGSNLQAPSRKLKQVWIGPLRIAEILDETHYLINDWQGLIIPIRVHKNRVKPYILSLNTLTAKGLLDTIRTSSQLLKRLSQMQDSTQQG